MDTSKFSLLLPSFRRTCDNLYTRGNRPYVHINFLAQYDLLQHLSGHFFLYIYGERGGFENIFGRSFLTLKEEKWEQPTFLQEFESINETCEPNQIGNRFIIIPTNKGLLLIHQRRAHKRILFEHFKNKMGLTNSD